MTRQNDRLYIDGNTREYYEYIRKMCPIRRLSNSDLFSLALSIGYQHGLRMPLKKKFAFIRHETISSDLFSVMILLAIDEYGMENNDWMDNPLDIFDLVEEYANCGIRILFEKFTKHDFDLDDYLTLTIFELSQKYDFEAIKEEFF